MKIICKTTLLPPPPPPPPPFVGTSIRIKLDDPASLTWGINKLMLADGHEKAVIDWGDGISVETAETQITHTYAQLGEYEVRISDDIDTLGCSNRLSDSPYQRIYAPMIREFQTNAVLLREITQNAFHKASNLQIVRCEVSCLHVLAVRSFSDCPLLEGRLDFPCVENVNYLAFSNSPGITELHFSKANEATIKALPDWEKSGGKFGADNATAFFDL